MQYNLTDLPDWPSTDSHSSFAADSLSTSTLQTLLSPFLTTASQPRILNTTFPASPLPVASTRDILSSPTVQLVSITGVHDLGTLREDLGRFVRGWAADVWARDNFDLFLVGEVAEGRDSDGFLIGDGGFVGRTDGLEEGVRVQVWIGIEREGMAAKEAICAEAWEEFVIQGKRGREVEVVEVEMKGEPARL
jgi:hypothetical protein